MATATLQYQWKGYSAIEELDRRAWDIPATIRHAAGVVISTGERMLAELREELEEAGLTRAGASIVSKYDGGRWFPTWREVWRDEDEPAPVVPPPHFELSPQAQKAKSEAAARQSGYNPTLARTTTHLVLQRPTRGSAQYQSDFVGWVKRELPAFTFNAKRGWWEADLTEENYRAVFTADSELNISDGARKWYAGFPGKTKKEEQREMKDEGKLVHLAKHALAKYPELTSRAMNAAELVRRGHVKPTGDHFEVTSQSDAEETYTVDLEQRSCTCYDWTSSQAPVVCDGKMCKHRLAALLWLQMQPAAPDPARIHREEKRIQAQLSATVPAMLI